jgi:enoyl-CoA hydratase/carnithine racemase
VAVNSDSELQLVIDAVSAAPQAAYTLVHSLRATALLPVSEALVAESAAYSLLLGGPEFARWLSEQPRRPAPPPADEVRLTRDEGTLRIALARPERRNAFSAAMRDALVEAFRLVLADDSITTVELSGDGPCFSSGGDLVEFGTTPDTATAHLVRTLQSPARLLAAVADRVSAHVQGPCIGAGVELPSFAGNVVAAPGTTFTLPELGMGLIPGAGGTVGIARRIGRQRTAWLALTAAPLDAETALAWGLVDEIGEPG